MSEIKSDKIFLCQQRLPHSISGTSTNVVVTYLVGFLVFALILSQTLREKYEPSSPVSARRWNPGAASSLRERSLMTKISEQQLQLDQLRAQLDKALAREQLRESNVQAQDATIRSLRQRYDTEKTARSKAQWALSERTSALDTCQAHNAALRHEAVGCEADLAAARAAIDSLSKAS